MLWIESVKKVETRDRRIPDAVRMLTEGRKQR
ncbi:MAG: YdeI/OmpD-associated family protein [Dermatophilaceae bacterium]